MLDYIEVDNYKSISHAGITFSKENVIVGPNGSGKSNLLDAIHFLRDCAVDGLDHAVTKRHGINSIRRWSKTRTYHITLKVNISLGNEAGSYKVSIASANGDFFVTEEEGHWTGRNPFFINDSHDEDNEKKRNEHHRYYFKRTQSGPVEFDIPNTPFSVNPNLILPESELLLTQLSGHSANAYSWYFARLFGEISSCGAYSIYPNRIREPQTISNADVLFDDGSNLASIIRQMRATNFRSNRENLTRAVRQVLPIVTEIHINSAGGFFVPTFRVREAFDSPSHDLNMSQISDGTLRMLGMLTAFYQPKSPKRITLEEPEQMIHPGLLPILVDSARDFLDDTRDERQIFFTTHSPNLLDLFEPGSIISASYSNGVSNFDGLSSRQMKIVKDRLFTAGQLLVAEGLFD